METGKYHLPPPPPSHGRHIPHHRRFSDSFYYPPPPMSMPERTVVLEPRPDDVMFGRGVPIQTHPGNRRLHLIADAYKERYRDARNDVKLEIVATVVARVQSYGGRFLKSHKVDDRKFWFEVSDAEAREKCRHTIRTRMLRDGAGAGREKEESANANSIANVADSPTNININTNSNTNISDEKEGKVDHQPAKIQDDKPPKTEEPQVIPSTPDRSRTPPLANDQDLMPKSRVLRAVSDEVPVHDRAFERAIPSVVARLDYEDRRPDYYNRSPGSGYVRMGRPTRFRRNDDPYFRSRDILGPHRSAPPPPAPHSRAPYRRYSSSSSSPTSPTSSSPPSWRPPHLSLAEEEKMLRSRLAEIQEVRDTAAFLYARRRASMMG